MGKIASSAFKAAFGDKEDKQDLPIQEVVNGVVVPVEEEEVNFTVRVPVSFKDKWDLYVATHQAELRAQGIKTLKAFFLHMAFQYMNENP